MKKLFAMLLAGLLLAPVARAAEAPDVLIRRMSTEMIDRIKADPDLQAGRLDRMSELVDAVVMPHVDFQRMTALAVGRGWNSATAEQQKRLMTEFRALLLRTYAGALASAKDQTVRMKPLRANPADKEVVVRSEVLQPRGGEPIQLDYRLSRSEDNWKIFDVSVLGVWLVQTYRSQFAQEIGASGIDGLIRSLAEKNRSSGEAGRS